MRGKVFLVVFWWFGIGWCPCSILFCFCTIFLLVPFPTVSVKACFSAQALKRRTLFILFWWHSKELRLIRNSDLMVGFWCYLCSAKELLLSSRSNSCFLEGLEDWFCSWEIWSFEMSGWTFGCWSNQGGCGEA